MNFKTTKLSTVAKSQSLQCIGGGTKLKVFRLSISNLKKHVDLRGLPIAGNRTLFKTSSLLRMVFQLVVMVLFAYFIAPDHKMEKWKWLR